MVVFKRGSNQDHVKWCPSNFIWFKRQLKSNQKPWKSNIRFRSLSSITNGCWNQESYSSKKYIWYLENFDEISNQITDQSSRHTHKYITVKHSIKQDGLEIKKNTVWNLWSLFYTQVKNGGGWWNKASKDLTRTRVQMANLYHPSPFRLRNKHQNKAKNDLPPSRKLPGNAAPKIT